MIYLLDANTLIEAKNRYYQMSICPGYWDWLLRANQAGKVHSIRSVRDELQRGNDALAVWAKEHAPLFLDESDHATQTAFAEVAQHLARRCCINQSEKSLWNQLGATHRSLSPIKIRQ